MSTLPRELLRTEGLTVRMKFLGGDPKSVATGVKPLQSKSHYFQGKEPARWITEVPHYAAVRYEELYPGIDLVFYGNEGELEYDLEVAPGASTNQVRIRFEGGEKLSLDHNGDLLLDAGGESIRMKRPVAYQPDGITRKAVAVRYVVDAEAQEVSFAPGSYDEGRALVIDPILIYSTYIGGSGSQQLYDVAVDAEANVYVVGSSWRGVSSPFNGAYVAKIRSDGSEIIFETYLQGGDSETVAQAVALDGQDYVIVGGHTYSSDFPTVNPVQAENAGYSDAFVTKLDPSGSRLAFSSYLGGASDDSPTDIAVDLRGIIYLTGGTYSTDFPTVNAVQSQNRGYWDAFVAAIEPVRPQLLYSSYLGGNQVDESFGIANDAGGAVVVVGETSSEDFPTARAWNPRYGGLGDGFATKLAPNGGFLFSTFFGGTGTDRAEGVALDGAGDIYVAGYTFSEDFPTARPLQMRGGASDAFVLKLNAAGSSLLYSTYLGGAGWEYGQEVAVDRTGNIQVAGAVISDGFPVVDPIQDHLAGPLDGFLSKLDPKGTRLIYSTYLGGSELDFLTGLATDSAGNAVVVGWTNSPDFPVENAIQPSLEGTADGFVVKVGPGEITASIRIFTFWTHYVAVALFSTEQLRAENVDGPTVRFGDAGAQPLFREITYDLNQDGYKDLLFFFRMQDTGAPCGESMQALTGTTKGGVPFSGTGSMFRRCFTVRQPQ